MSVPNLDRGQIRRLLASRRNDLLNRSARIERDLQLRSAPLIADLSEHDAQLQDDETLQVMGAVAEQEIKSIEEALQRLDRGLYGICKRCERAIGTTRLSAVPDVVVCARCTDA